MQCSVVKFTQEKNITDFRIDAECFKPIHLQTAELISRLPNSTIGQMSRSVINFGAYFAWRTEGQDLGYLLNT